jgi:hypothetical protein
MTGIRVFVGRVALGCAVLIALLVGNSVYREYRYEREISSAHATGLGAVSGVGWDPVSLWRQRPGLAQSAVMTYSDLKDADADKFGVMLQKRQTPHSAQDEMVIRTVRLTLVVEDATKAGDQLGQIVREYRGVVESMSREEGAESQAVGTMTVRVPSEQLTAAVARLRSAALSVRAESMETRDVRREWADESARLTAMNAEEQQYLRLMQRAKSVSEVLTIQQSLSHVRQEIEAKEAVLRTMANDVSLSQITITLLPQSAAKVMGIAWAPLLTAKSGLHACLEGLADWSSMLIALMMRLPMIALWAATLVGMLWVLWWVAQWTWKFAFARKSVS